MNNKIPDIWKNSFKYIILISYIQIFSEYSTSVPAPSFFNQVMEIITITEYKIQSVPQLSVTQAAEAQERNQCLN